MRRFGRAALLVALLLVALVCLSYLIDLVLLRYRYSGHGKAFDTVIVRRYFAIAGKNGKTEYMDDDPKRKLCVESLYPHAASPPCWYLKRHPEERIDR